MRMVEPDSTVHTDDWSGYANLGSLGYVHDVFDLFPHVEGELLHPCDMIAESLDKWLWRMYRGAISRQHLDSYLDEFSFRFNYHRNYRGRIFYRFLCRALRGSA